MLSTMNNNVVKQERSCKKILSNDDSTHPAFTVGGCEVPYRDYMKISVQEIKKEVKPPKETTRKGPRGGVSETFPVKLYAMLEGMEKEGNEGIISWQPHGRCFLIRSPTIFADRILPRYFKQSKLTSFNRQLNLYGFQKVSVGADRGAHYHPLFLRGRPDICKVMLRTRVKGGAAPVTDADAEVDKSLAKSSFYALPICPPARIEVGIPNAEDIPVDSDKTAQDDHCQMTREVSEPISYFSGLDNAVFDLQQTMTSFNREMFQEIEPLVRISKIENIQNQKIFPSSVSLENETKQDIHYQHDFECKHSTGCDFIDLPKYIDNDDDDDEVGLFEGHKFHFIEKENLVAFESGLLQL